MQSTELCVPATVRLPTVGRRAFSVAGTRVRNALPADVTSAPSLLTNYCPTNALHFIVLFFFALYYVLCTLPFIY